nr:PQQ-dependent sugar dehydrogenase [Ardenticatena sp.]
MPKKIPLWTALTLAFVFLILATVLVWQWQRPTVSPSTGEIRVLATVPPTQTPAPTATHAPTTTSIPAATATTRPTPRPTETPTPAWPPRIALEPFVSLGEGDLVYMTSIGDGSGRLFLVQRQGFVYEIRDGAIDSTPFLDVSALVETGFVEQGLLSLAFSPDFAQSREFYINYTAKSGRGDTIVARYRVGADGRADPTSARTILQIDQPAANHNGGLLLFGPDGYLYIGTGDGGAAGDPWNNAERLDTLLGKLLRIDVIGQETYAIPRGNPFDPADGQKAEIWAYGLRNPWRFSFDRLTGDLYIADVGQDAWEEVNFTPAGSPGGLHYGWDTMEGAHCFEPPEGCDTSGKVLPVAEYDHSFGCSITGGYVYRGTRFPSLSGTYFFGDYCSGRIWGLRQHNGQWQLAELLDTNVFISSFAEDEAGELYVLDLRGDVYHLTAE